MPEEPLAYKPISGYDKSLYTPTEQKKEYIPTWCEYAAQHFQTISKCVGQTGTGVLDLYVVPENCVFYVTAFYINASNGCSASISTTNFGNLVYVTALNATTVSSGGPCSMPLRLPTKQTIGLVIAGPGNASATIQGFLVPFSA